MMIKIYFPDESPDKVFKSPGLLKGTRRFDNAFHVRSMNASNTIGRIDVEEMLTLKYINFPIPSNPPGGPSPPPPHHHQYFTVVQAYT